MLSRNVASVILAVISTCLLCAACSSGSTDSSARLDKGQDPPAELLAQLPGLPQEQWSEQAQREASAIFSYELEASSFFDTNANYLFPSDLAMFPEDGKLSYAIFRLSGIDPTAIITALEVHLLKHNPGSEIHFGLADYTASRWQFMTLTAEESTAEFELRDYFDASRMVSPGYAAYLAIVVEDPDARVEVDKLVVSADGEVVPPPYFNASDALYGDRVQLNWSPVPNAEQYDIFYKLESEDEAAYELLTTVAGDKQTVNHAHDSVPPCLYNVVYEYRIRVIGEDGPSVDSASDTGYRRTPTPQYLLATDRMFPDRVQLWFPDSFEDNMTIDIYRDDALLAAGEEPQQDGGFGSSFLYWEDTTVSQGEEYEYYIVANGDNGASEPSPKDTGCSGESSNAQIESDLTPAEFLGTALSFGPVGSEQIGYAYIESDDGVLEFLHSDPFVPSFPSVEQVMEVETGSAECSIESLSFGGRPYLAFPSDDDAVAAEGLWLAWPANPIPDGDEDWNTMLLDPGRIQASRIAMAEFSGGIGIMYVIRHADLPDEFLKFCWIPDPDGGPIDNHQVSFVRSYPNDEEHPQAFDMVDYNGLPSALYGLGIQGTSRIYGLNADSLPPDDENDWTDYKAIDFEQQYGSPQDIDLVLHDGRLNAALGIGNGETDCFLVAASSHVPFPDSRNHWGGSIVQDLDGQAPQGVSIMFQQDTPLIALNDGDSAAPRLFRPVGDGLGQGLNFNKWIEYEISSDPDYSDIRGRPGLLDFGGILLMIGDVFDSTPGDERHFVQFVVEPKDLPF